ncbi:MAG: NUDIX domain-containing protein [Candidatus Ratteibacteria bacterium]
MNLINYISDNMEKNRYFISDRVIEISYNKQNPFNAGETAKHQPLVITCGSKSEKSPCTIITLPGLKKGKMLKLVLKKIFYQHAKPPNEVTFFIHGGKEKKFNSTQVGCIIIEEVICEFLKNTLTKEFKLIFTEKHDMDKCLEIAEPLLAKTASKTFKNPYPAADTIITKEGGVVLVYRKNPPSGWAIPGGFINWGETAENAAIREAKEETGLDIDNLKLFGVFSDPERDPRFHTISIVYTGQGKGTIKAGDDAAKVAIFSESNLPNDIAFDHRKILKQFFKKRRI